MRGFDDDLDTDDFNEEIMSFFLQLIGWNVVGANLLRACIKMILLPAHFKHVSIVFSFHSKSGMGKTTFFKLLEKYREGESVRLTIESLTGTTFSRIPRRGKRPLKASHF